MRIKAFSYFLEGHLQPHTLNNSTVVIDGQSLFFKMYKESKIQYALGCESDRFASYIKECLEKFKKANVNCYIVFKGGHTDKNKLDLHFEAENRLHGRNYHAGYSYDDIVKPIFAKDIWFQVLDELDLQYSICNDDHVTECVILARKLSCPVISFNIQYFFAQIQYIPETSLVLDERNNLKCGVVTLSRVLNKFNLTEEKMILFLMLTDHHIFNEDFFTNFFRRHRMAFRNVKLIESVLWWLARYSQEQARSEIFKCLSASEQTMFLEKQGDLEKLTLKRKGTSTKMVLYVTDKDKADITKSDPDWFEKGVFFKHIAIPYVNLYRFKIIKASNFIEDYEQENSIMLSLDIVKYAFDLLTNFEGGEIYVEHKKGATDENAKDLTLTFDHSLPKPDYEATHSVFEDGWVNIKEFKLFQHFVTESLQTFDFARLNSAPADFRLLLVALVYFSRKKPDVKCEVYSVLLSYVMLGVVFQKADTKRDGRDSNAVDRPLLDSFTNKDLVTAPDCDTAWYLMKKYFELRNDELCYKFDRKKLHPLVEFQRCLQEFNYLNQLCGSPLDTTVYSKTYNGTFVYNVLHAMEGDGLQFIKMKLNPAPTVLAFLSGLIELYDSILYEF